MSTNEVVDGLLKLGFTGSKTYYTLKKPNKGLFAAHITDLGFSLSEYIIAEDFPETKTTVFDLVILDSFNDLESLFANYRRSIGIIGLPKVA